jgi:predicted nucleic acid-binding protein
MKVFFDTSSLFKLYHREADSSVIENIFTANTLTEVFLSELTKIEFTSAVWKKFRVGDITNQQAAILVESFENDFSKYTFIQVDNVVVQQARNLLVKHGSHGLRTLDSVQLSTAVLLRSKADLFVSTDKLLHSFLQQELLPTNIQGSL